MNPHLENKIRRIEKVSRLLRGICTAVIVPVGIAAVVASVSAFTGRLTHLTYFNQTISTADLEPFGRGVLAIIVLITGAVLIKALFHLRRLLSNYARREIFTGESARLIRSLGLTCILWGVVKIAWALVPLFQPQAPRLVSINFDTMLIGALIVAVSWFAEMAAELREENDLTI